MLKLFYLNDEGDYKIDEEILAIPCFKTIHERDKVKGKKKALNELMYVFFTTSYTSPYYNIPETERIDTVSKHLYPDKLFVPDEVVLEACRIYNQLQETSFIRLIRSYDNAIEQFTTYFNNFSIDAEESQVKEVRQTMKDVGDLIDSREKISKKIKEEIIETNKIRGKSNRSVLEDMRKKGLLKY